MSIGAPLRIGFLLIDGFGLLPYASLIGAFKAANSFSGEALYSWQHIALRDKNVMSSSGVSLVADVTLDDPVAADTIFVISGRDVTGNGQAEFRDKRTFAWLRRMAAAGVRIGGVSSGPFILARAGLLDNYRCTTHWNSAETFMEQFPNAIFEYRLFVMDRKRITCAGGSSTLDLGLDLIEREQGPELARKVGEWFIRTSPRAASDRQRAQIGDRYGTQNPKLLRVLAHMESSIEVPARRDVLDRIAGLSSRQLERLFQSQLGARVGQVYRQIRLDHAATLLQKTGMSITEVAIASGFSSSSHFSRAFKAYKGCMPKQLRAGRERSPAGNGGAAGAPHRPG